MRTRRWLYTGVWLGALALLSACGGDDDAAAPVIGAPAALSVENEAILSAAAVLHVSTLQGVVDFGTGLTGSDSASISARASAARALKAVMKAGRVGALATASTTIDCESGTLTTELADDLSAVAVRFAACLDGGVTNDGELTLSRVSISQDGLQQVYDGVVDVASTDGTVKDKVQGLFRLSLDRSTAGQDVAELSSTLLSFQHRSGQFVDVLELSEVQQKSVLSDTGARAETFSFNTTGNVVLGSDGSVTRTANVAYKVETLTALATPDLLSDPVSGQIRITVAGKGIILLTPEATRVHVQADLEGNGSFEVDRFQTWSNLAGPVPS